MKILVVLALFMTSFFYAGSSANAEEVTAFPVRITSLVTYAERGFERDILDGDVVVSVEQPPPECNGGFWLRASQNPGYETTVKFLQEALLRGLTLRIRIVGETDDLFEYSSSSVCRIVAVSLARPT